MRVARFLPLLSLVTLAALAQGNEEYVGETPDGNIVYSYRTDRIEQSALGLSVWVYSHAKHPVMLRRDGKPWRAYMSSAESWQVSCQSRSFYTEQATYFDKDGAVIFNGGPTASQKAIPDSLADMLIAAVCTKVRAK